MHKLYSLEQCLFGGFLYLNLTNYDKAVDDFSKAAQLNPAFARAYVERAYAYNLEHLYDLSLMDCNMAIMLKPEDAEAYLYKGNTFAGKQNYDKAIEIFDKAIELDPNFVWTYQARALTYADIEDYPHAVADFDKVIQLQTTNAWAFACRGLSKSRQGDFRNGIKDCQRGILLDTNCYTAYNNLAWLLATAPQSELRDGQKAVEYAERACELTSWKNAYSLGTLAAADAEIGNFTEAVKWEKKCILSGLPEKEMHQAHKELDLFEQKKPYHADE